MTERFNRVDLSNSQTKTYTDQCVAAVDKIQFEVKDLRAKTSHIDEMTKGLEKSKLELNKYFEEKKELDQQMAKVKLDFDLCLNKVKYLENYMDKYSNVQIYSLVNETLEAVLDK